jgi:hypothetical protein
MSFLNFIQSDEERILGDSYKGSLGELDPISLKISPLPTVDKEVTTNITVVTSSFCPFPSSCLFYRQA